MSLLDLSPPSGARPFAAAIGCLLSQKAPPFPLPCEPALPTSLFWTNLAQNGLKQSGWADGTTSDGRAIAAAVEGVARRKASAAYE